MAIKRLPSTGDAPRTTGVPESLVPGGAADSAGYPWAGRTFEHHETAFASDDGETPDSLRDAVDRLRQAASASSLTGLADAHAAVIEVLGTVRVLVPLLAEAGAVGVTPEGRKVEKTQELSIVTVSAPDGRRVMPVFSSTASMRAWNPEARPIPVPMPQAAVAAASEQTDLIIIDAGSPDQELGIRRTELESVAHGRPRMPAWANRDVEHEFERIAATEPRIEQLRLAPGDPRARLLAPEVDVLLRLTPGLDRTQLEDVVASLQAQFAASDTIANEVDSLRIVLR